MTRCPPECGRQWRPKQGKSGWQKQKEEEAKEEAGKKREEKEEKQKKKQKREKTVDVKRLTEEWEIWDEEEEAAKSEEDAKKLVPEKFHKWIKVFGKKQSERMPTRKIWDHAIDTKEGEGVSVVEEGERRGARVHSRTIEEGVYQTLEVTSNGTSVFCRKEGW